MSSKKSCSECNKTINENILSVLSKKKYSSNSNLDETFTRNFETDRMEHEESQDSEGFTSTVIEHSRIPQDQDGDRQDQTRRPTRPRRRNSKMKDEEDDAGEGFTSLENWSNDSLLSKKNNL